MTSQAEVRRAAAAFAAHYEASGAYGHRYHDNDEARGDSGTMVGGAPSSDDVEAQRPRGSAPPPPPGSAAVAAAFVPAGEGEGDAAVGIGQGRVGEGAGRAAEDVDAVGPTDMVAGVDSVEGVEDAGRFVGGKGSTGGRWKHRWEAGEGISA